MPYLLPEQRTRRLDGKTWEAIDWVYADHPHSNMIRHQVTKWTSLGYKHFLQTITVREGNFTPSMVKIRVLYVSPPPSLIHGPLDVVGRVRRERARRRWLNTRPVNLLGHSYQSIVGGGK